MKSHNNEHDEVMDDLIGEWHDSPEDGRTLHEFLGLTWEEYGKWLQTNELPSGYVPSERK